MIDICLFGAGMIGAVHAGNVRRHPRARLKYVVDPNAEAATRIAAATGAEVTDVETALTDPAIRGVIIASATRTHADLSIAAAQSGKAIFCEKPIDMDIARTDACLAVIRETGALFQIGFNRRFDPSFAALKQRILDGEIGAVEQVVITSRDPEPEAEAAVAAGGGLYREMTIHDFDMARHMLGEEPVELFAAGACLIQPYFARHGDVDSAMFILRTESGKLCHINNSARAVYGYDQRVEVHGSGGMLSAGNRRPTSVELSSAAAVSRDKPLHFFIERYQESYFAELDHFLDCIETGTQPSVGTEDGRRAMLMCEAAKVSAVSGRFEPLGF
ncbi:inositol 2-dehydrogenase [Paracoccus pacificus]|uniref:Inositol 2-dehydrogenase n=1 Tax=Paracoccus pacificus TaxID=1463598 RepID=A0ABW4R4Y5_9RHOB